jgi:hypothetical protein
MRPLFPLALVLAIAGSGCSVEPFTKESGATGGRSGSSHASAGSGPVLSPPTGAATTAPEGALEIPPPVTTPLPRERPKVPPATLTPASRALVSQAEAQRKKGDLPGATVSLERALRIEPNNPLLWVEMGRLRMDQHNYAQAENMGRKALAMSIGDDSTQSLAWQLIADSYRARGRNAEAQEALEKAKALRPQ